VVEEVAVEAAVDTAVAKSENARGKWKLYFSVWYTVFPNVNILFKIVLELAERFLLDTWNAH